MKKKLVRKTKLELDDELSDLMDNAAKVKGTSEIKTGNPTKAKSSEPIYLEILEDDDPFFTIPTKEWINNQKISLQDIYDQKKQIDGYNMYHSLAAKHQLGKERITEWAMLRGYKPVLTFVPATQEEINDYNLRKEEKLNKKKNK